MGIVIPYLDSEINSNGFMLTASSTDPTGRVYGPFQNNGNYNWIAATGNINESLSIECLYPFSCKSFVIQSNMSTWMIEASDNGLDYIILYNIYDTPLNINDMYYQKFNFAGEWKYLSIVNGDTLPDNKKVTIKFFQCFD